MASSSYTNPSGGIDPPAAFSDGGRTENYTASPVLQTGTTQVRIVPNASSFTRDAIPLATPFLWGERAQAQAEQDAVLLKDMFHNPTQIAGLEDRFEGVGITFLKRRVFGQGDSSDSAKAIVAQLLQRHGVSIHDLHRSGTNSGGDSIGQDKRDESPESLYGQPMQDPSAVAGFTRKLPDRSVPSLEMSSSTTMADHQKTILQRAKKEGAGAWSTMTTVLKLFEPEISQGEGPEASVSAEEAQKKIISAKTVMRHASLTLPPSRLPGSFDAKTMILSMLQLLSSEVDGDEFGSDSGDSGEDGQQKALYFPNLPLIRVVGSEDKAPASISVKDLERQSFEKVGDWTLTVPQGPASTDGGASSTVSAVNTFLIQLRNLERRFFDAPKPWPFLSRVRFVPPGWTNAEMSTIMWKGTLPASRRKEVEATATTSKSSSAGAPPKKRKQTDNSSTASAPSKKTKKLSKPVETIVSQPPSLAFSSSTKMQSASVAPVASAFTLENPDDTKDGGEEESLGETEDEDESDEEGGRDFGFAMGFGAGGGASTGGTSGGGGGGFLDDDLDDDDLPDIP